MGTFHFLSIAIAVILSLSGVTQSYPIKPIIKQEPLLPSAGRVSCDSIDIYTTEWFLLNTLPQHRQEIHAKALFYTKGTSKQARQLACNSREFVTLWDIWPQWLYDNQDLPSNKLRCIHKSQSLRTTFYENMSRAYARMARKHATIMHSFADYDAPPMKGIWGRIELPTLQKATDIAEMDKINEDRSLSDVFLVSEKAAYGVLDAAMKEVQSLFRQAKSTFVRIGSGSGSAGTGGDRSYGSCSFWNSETDGFLDSLF